jgi:hypothetical protein
VELLNCIVALSHALVVLDEKDAWGIGITFTEIVVSSEQVAVFAVSCTMYVPEEE